MGDRWALRGRASREWGKLPLVLAIACALLLALGISLAVAGKGVESFFGERGSGDGQFETPRDVAVYNGTALNDGTDDIYVVDDVNHRVQRFDSVPPYAFEAKFGGQGPAGGQFNRPQGIAINQSNGAIYVRDRDNLRVQQFDADGTFVRAWGWDVVASGPGDDVTAPVNEFEICVAANGDTCKTGTSGAAGGQFATSSAFGGGIAVAPATGDVFVADPVNRRVQQFESDGDFVRLWGWDVVSTTQAGDLGTNNFEVCQSTATGVCKAGATASPSTSNGQFGTNQPLHLAADSEGVVYASDSTSSGRVMRFDTTQATAAALLLSPIGVPPLISTVTTSMEVDPSNDHLLISRANLGIQELDTTTLAVVDTHMTGSGLTPTGLGIDSSDGEIMVSSTSTTGGSIRHRVYVLDNVAAPDAEIAPVTDITSDSATFNGTVDPNGSSTGYHFEYGTDGLTWTRAPATFDVDAGAGDDPVEVSLPVAPLEPDTDYRVRLVATKPFGAGIDTSAEALFSTPPARPTIVSSGAEPGSTTATLRGRIHPHGQETTYHFEYGLTDSYGNFAPVPDGNIGSGDAVQSVEEPISGLAPNTTYHFRLVAANGTGETQGPDGTFTTLPASGPSARAYEKVSPEDKNGGDTQGTATGQTGFASPSGDELVYTASQAFDNADGTTIVGSVYRARRQPTAWLSTPVLPPMEPFFRTSESWVSFMSKDLSRAVVTTNAVLDTGAVAEECNAYVRDLEARTYEFIAHNDPAIGEGCGKDPRNVVGTDATPDLSAVLIETTGELTPDAAEVPRDGPVVQPKLYLWRDGQLELASVVPGGPAAGTPTTGSAGVDGISDLLDNSISDDGSVVFFTGWDRVGHPPPLPPGGNLALYRRSGGQTVALSAEENSLQDPCGPPGGVCVGNSNTAPLFGAASSDGSRVFFTSKDQLVDEDSDTPGVGSARDLYMYTHSADPEDDDNLTLISRDLEPGPPAGADVLGVLGASDDGSRVYFAAKNQIVPGEDAAPADIKFYVWDEDEGVRYIGGGLSNPTFTGFDPNVASTIQGHRGKRSVSANGRGAIFMSSIPLTADDNGGQPQAYLYDFAADQLVCVSCPATSSLGEPGTATSLRSVGEPGRTASDVLPNPGPRILSDDGARAFFETDSRLVPEDTNGLVDVYAWEGGAPHLISSGQSGDRSLFIDASANGDDVFFGTRERLVPWDEDNLRDTYVARVGGGLPDPRPSTGTPCQGDDCQGTPAGPPALMDPFSDVFGGFGNLEPGERPSFGIRRLSKAQLAKLARGGGVMLPVKVNRAGRLSLIARAKMGKRNRVVDRSSKRATKAGTVGVPLQLSKASRRQLARKGKLGVSVSVRFAGVREPRGMTLRLQRAGGRG
jgi:NHL repeat-containing protein